MKKSFKSWLVGHKSTLMYGGSAISDLARDVRRDWCFPRKVYTQEQFEEKVIVHMTAHGACENALNTARKAFAEYRGKP